MNRTIQLNTCSKLLDLKFSKPNISSTDIVCADELLEEIDIYF
jgi:hypothetical protein